MHEAFVALDGDAGRAEHLAQRGAQGVAAHERVAGPDVEVEVGQRLQVAEARIGPVVGVLEQLNPEPQPANAHRGGVEVDAEQGVLHQGALLAEQGRLQARVLVGHGALAGGGVVGRYLVAGGLVGGVVEDEQLVVLHAQGVVEVLALVVEQQAQVGLEGQQLVEGTHQEVARAHGRVQHGEAVEPAGVLGAPLLVEAVAQLGPVGAAF